MLWFLPLLWNVCFSVLFCRAAYTLLHMLIYTNSILRSHGCQTEEYPWVREKVNEKHKMQMPFYQRMGSQWMIWIWKWWGSWAQAWQCPHLPHLLYGRFLYWCCPPPSSKQDTKCGFIPSVMFCKFVYTFSGGLWLSEILSTVCFFSLPSRKIKKRYLKHPKCSVKLGHAIICTLVC